MSRGPFIIDAPAWPTPRALSYEADDTSSTWSRPSVHYASSGDETGEPLPSPPPEAEVSVKGLSLGSTVWLLLVAFFVGLGLGRYGGPLVGYMGRTDRPTRPTPRAGDKMPPSGYADMGRAELHRHQQPKQLTFGNSPVQGASVSSQRTLASSLGDLASELELREMAEQRLANCRAFGPSHC